MKTIWCLFSVENNYDQPSNNLIAWWSDKPSAVDLELVIKVDLSIAPIDGEKVLKVWSGEEVRFNDGCGLGGYDYRLEQIEEGIV